MITSDYVAMRFDAAEGWKCVVDGPKGAAALHRRTWKFDFSKGAKSIGLVPADISLLGSPKQIRIRLRGSTGGRPLRIRLMTHFMAFERSVPVPAGDGKRDIVTSAPPGKGWRWFGGENDGKIHGPLRIAGLYLDAAGRKDTGVLELLDIRVKAECPATRTSILTAEVRGGAAKREFVATFRSMTPKPFSASVACVVRDWDERTIASHKRTLAVSTDGPTEVAVPVPRGDHTFLEAVFTAAARGQQVPQATTCWVAPLRRRGSGKPDPSSPFGMGLYLYRYPNTPGGLREMDHAAGLAKAAGVKWSREEFSWSMIEPVKGKPDWSLYDALIATARRHGISVYGLLDYWSPWTKPYTREGIADYCRFAEAVVRRYRKDVQVWEVWNEPNIFFWQGPKEMYADLLKSAYAAIKKADPNARVAGCSTAGIDLKFIRRMQKLGAPFDILTIHPYRVELDDRKFVNDLVEVAKLVRRPDGSPREVWITEMGWGTQTPHNSIGQPWAETTQRQQAQLIARTYIDAIASGVSPNISWYDFRCDGTNPLEWEHNLGILRRDFSPKPAYKAFATLTRMLAGKRECETLDLGKDVIAYRFTAAKGGGSVIALWSTSRARAVSVPASGPVVVTDLMGRSTPRRPKDGAVKVSARRLCPVFISAGASGR